MSKDKSGKEGKSKDILLILQELLFDFCMDSRAHVFCIRCARLPFKIKFNPWIISSIQAARTKIKDPRYGMRDIAQKILEGLILVLKAKVEAAAVARVVKVNLHMILIEIGI